MMNNTQVNVVVSLSVYCLHKDNVVYHCKSVDLDNFYSFTPESIYDLSPSTIYTLFKNKDVNSY